MPQKRRNKIGIDFLGSDNRPEIFLEALEKVDNVDVVAFITASMESLVAKKVHSSIITSEVIEMNDDPLYAIRHKKNSSINIGLRLLKEKKIEAFISAGNTGALLAAATTIIPKIKPISRPALLAFLPTKLSPIAVIDVGANILTKTKHLLEFAYLGIAAQKFFGIEKPSVGLLNIGSEERKGSLQLREVHEELKVIAREKNFNFAGNIEGREVFDGAINVLVTNGFAGNIFLKTAEGTASFLLDELQKNQKEQLKEKLQWEEHLGGILCGIDGLIIKCHGLSSPKAIASSIKNSDHLLNENFIDSLKANLVSF